MEAILPTSTFYEVVGNTISITSSYQEIQTNIQRIFIATFPGFSGVPYTAGDEVAKLDSVSDIYFNEMGELLINDIDSDKYSFDENGDLIYTE